MGVIWERTAGHVSSIKISQIYNILHYQYYSEKYKGQRNWFLVEVIIILQRGGRCVVEENIIMLFHG